MGLPTSVRGTQTHDRAACGLESDDATIRPSRAGYDRTLVNTAEVNSEPATSSSIPVVQWRDTKEHAGTMDQAERANVIPVYNRKSVLDNYPPIPLP